jgi:hypothetical protein
MWPSKHPEPDYGLFDSWSQFWLVFFGAIVLDALVITLIMGLLSIGGVE